MSKFMPCIILIYPCKQYQTGQKENTTNSTKGKPEKAGINQEKEMTIRETSSAFEKSSINEKV